MIRQQSCVELVETFIVITCVCIINLQFKRPWHSGDVINQLSANLCYLSQDRMENCGIVFVYHLYYAYLCGAWVGTNRSLYMVQFRATNLLENLLDFHLEGVLLLQIEKCSMSSSIVAWEVPDDFVYFLIFFFACVRASQSDSWISSKSLVNELSAIWLDNHHFISNHTLCFCM